MKFLVFERIFQLSGKDEEIQGKIDPENNHKNSDDLFNQHTVVMGDAVIPDPKAAGTRGSKRSAEGLK